VNSTAVQGPKTIYWAASLHRVREDTDRAVVNAGRDAGKAL
jgi:hypothetical protein